MQYHYGILGTGAITSRFIKAIQAYGDDVSAIASRSLEKAQKAAATHAIAKAFGSYEELCEDTDIDIIYVATPNAFHYEHAYMALSHGKHVLVEKPFVLTEKQARSLFGFAKQQNVFLMEAQKSVFLPITLQLKEMIQTNAFGRLKQIQMLSSFPAQYDLSHWMQCIHGGVVYGSASYTIEYLQFLLDESITDFQMLGIQGKGGAIVDASINVKIQDLLANSHITMQVATKNIATFYFEQGYVEIPDYWKARKMHIYPDKAAPSTIHFPIDYEMIYEVAHVHDCLNHNWIESPVMSAKATISCVKIVEILMHKYVETI